MSLYTGNSTPKKIYVASGVVKAMTLGRTQIYGDTKSFAYTEQHIYSSNFGDSNYYSRSITFPSDGYSYSTFNFNGYNCVIVKIFTYAKSSDYDTYKIVANITAKIATGKTPSTGAVIFEDKRVTTTKEVTENVADTEITEILIPIAEGEEEIRFSGNIRLTKTSNNNSSSAYYLRCQILGKYLIDTGDNEETTATAVLGEAVVGEMILGEGE